MSVKCPKCHHENPDTQSFCGDCGTQLPSREDIEATETIEVPKEELTRGTTFANRCEIIEELGKTRFAMQQTRIHPNISKNSPQYSP